MAVETIVIGYSRNSKNSKKSNNNISNNNVRVNMSQY